jgi:hypothetical protein
LYIHSNLTSQEMSDDKTVTISSKGMQGFTGGEETGSSARVAGTPQPDKSM